MKRREQPAHSPSLEISSSNKVVLSLGGSSSTSDRAVEKGEVRNEEEDPTTFARRTAFLAVRVRTEVNMMVRSLATTLYEQGVEEQEVTNATMDRVV